MSLFGPGRLTKLFIYILCVMFPFFVIIYAAIQGSQSKGKNPVQAIVNVLLSFIICCALLCLLWIPGVVYAWSALEGELKYVLIV